MSKEISIKPRRVEFGIDESLNQYFYDNDPYKSTFLVALSSVFPAGEFFFIRSVRKYMDQIDDPELTKQIRGFIGQEAHHSKQHEHINNLFSEMGYPADQIDRLTERDLKVLGKILPKSYQLAVTTALEHFTAIMAHQFLTNVELQKGMDEKIKNLFLWHAVEETEHKAVAYDVFQKVSGSYLTRALVMVFTAIGFIFGISAIQAVMLHQKGQLFKLKTWRSGFGFMFGKIGFARKLFFDYFEYFKPNFHPWDQDNSYVLEDMQQDLKAWAA